MGMGIAHPLTHTGSLFFLFPRSLIKEQSQSGEQADPGATVC